MEIQSKEVSSCKFLIYLVGVNHKIYSRHVFLYLNPPSCKLKIYNMTVDIYTCKLIKDFGLNGSRSIDVITKYQQQTI